MNKEANFKSHLDKVMESLEQQEGLTFRNRFKWWFSAVVFNPCSGESWDCLEAYPTSYLVIIYLFKMPIDHPLSTKKPRWYTKAKETKTNPVTKIKQHNH